MHRYHAIHISGAAPAGYSLNSRKDVLKKVDQTRTISTQIQIAQVEILFAKERPKSQSKFRLDESDRGQRKRIFDSLHEMKFNEDTLRRAVKDLVHKATEQNALE